MFRFNILGMCVGCFIGIWSIPFSANSEGLDFEPGENSVSLLAVSPTAVVFPSGTPTSVFRPLDVPLAGADVEILDRPHIVDRMKDGLVTLVFNTTEGAQAMRDSFGIRATALAMKTPYYTTAAGAVAAARAIENLKEGTLEVAPLQDYVRRG